MKQKDKSVHLGLGKGQVEVVLDRKGQVASGKWQVDLLFVYLHLLLSVSITMSRFCFAERLISLTIFLIIKKIRMGR